jgi:wyosine [tRNA(Phe)-imidazoG37] synthetase (radical SAM superfamily)
MKTIFGPVPSRRLGRSLGIDVVSPKTCSYDCIYCESGRTTHLTLKRQAFVDPAEVLHELEDYFRNRPDSVDVLTFSGAGEPTLYLGLGELIRALKRRYEHLPLVVLTNGSLLWDGEVRRDLLEADRVVPSLDAVSDEVFQKLNRPHPGLNLAHVVEGLYAFRRLYSGEFHLEVMLVADINDQGEELRAIARVVDKLQPNRVELNTVVRPPADGGVCALTPQRMSAARLVFPAGKTEVIGRFAGAATSQKDVALAERIQELVRRRPCTLDEMAASLAVSSEEVASTAQFLRLQGILAVSRFANREYYRLMGCQATGAEAGIG